MMDESNNPIAAVLTHPTPINANRRLLLFAIRRIADGGLNDAHAANALFSAFGRGFRRPLVLLRAMMAEASRISARRLLVAPCCCPRMTESEAVLIDTVLDARANPAGSHARLATLLGTASCLGAINSAQALGQAFEDLGRPL